MHSFNFAILLFSKLKNNHRRIVASGLIPDKLRHRPANSGVHLRRRSGAVLLCNLASAQARVGQRADAIESVRWALRMDSGMVQAHLILGALLANSPHTRAEAILHLERAAEEYESARRILRQLR